MTSTSLPSSDYTTLLQGDHGFILALALTVLIILAFSFVVKLYFTWRRFQATGKTAGTNAVLVSDGWWLSSHIIAFTYVGVRIGTLGGLTDHNPTTLSSSQKAMLADENETCQILFVLALYLSFCSVFCAALAIMPSVSKSRNTAVRTSIYWAPGIVFVVGLLLCTLPHIECSNEWIFRHSHDLCPSASARMLPVMIILIILDIVIALGWTLFVQRQTKGGAGRISEQQSWLVAPFMLRFLVVGASIAFVALYVRSTAQKVPYFSTFYAEFLCILASLLATTSVSMNRILGKFNFGGMAYTKEPNARSHNQSVLGTISGTRATNDTSLWQGQLISQVSTNVGPGAPSRMDSGDSERHMLHDDAINRKVEVHQVWEHSTANSHSESSEER